MSAIKKKTGGMGVTKKKNKKYKEKRKAKIGHNQRKTQEEHQRTSKRMRGEIDNKNKKEKG
jgi:hypothetical protein